MPALITRTFKHISAGSTTILPDGKILSFNGPKGGHGTLVLTSDQEEAIKWVDSLVRTGKVWEEVAAKPEELPAAVTATIAADTQVVKDIEGSAERSSNPAVVAAMANIAKAVAGAK